MIIASYHDHDNGGVQWKYTVAYPSTTRTYITRLGYFHPRVLRYPLSRGVASHS